MRTLLFVCPHGAAKSRIAAAFSARVAPSGWIVTSAGIDPDPELSSTAARMLAGTDAEAYLDRGRPRSVGVVGEVDRVVGIDCDPKGKTDRWDLKHSEFDTAMRDELRARAEELATELRRG